MNLSVELKKLQIIDWVLHLKNVSLLDEIDKLKNNTQSTSNQLRKYGSGKHIFTYIADDFDAPLDDFKEYMQ